MPFIAIGLVSVLAVVTLRQDTPAAAALAESLAAIKDWTFLLGPGFIVGVGNGLLLGYLMYRSGLVPRPMAVLGLVGGPLVCASGIAVLFDVFEQGGAGQGIATIPEFLWSCRLASISPSKDSGRLRSSRGMRAPPCRRPDRWAVAIDASR